MAEIGHNSGQVSAGALTQAARDKLKHVVSKIEKLEEEKKETADEIRDVYAEAKSFGYCTKTLRKIVRLRKQDRQTREEEEAILDAYMLAIGEIA